MPQAPSNEIPFNRRGSSGSRPAASGGGIERSLAEAEQLLFHPSRGRSVQPRRGGLFGWLIIGVVLLALVVVVAAAFRGGFLVPSRASQRGVSQRLERPKGWRPQPRASDYLAHGIKHFKAREYDQASRAFRQALRLNPRSQRAHLWLGASYAMQGYRSWAAEEFRTVIALDPTTSDAKTARRLLKKLGFLREAKEAGRPFGLREGRGAWGPARPPGAVASNLEKDKAPSGSPFWGEAPKPAPAGPPATLPPVELYRMALNGYTRGNYELAIEGFRAYLQWFPKTTLAPGAQYWLGEAYFSQGEYRKAIEAFEGVVREYPESPKVPSALLKQGDAYLKLGEIDQAQGVFRGLVKQFPNSREARLARERL